MNQETTTKNFDTSNLKFHLRTMQMDLEEAKNGKTVKETEVVTPVKQEAPASKISFDKIAQELKTKPNQSSQEILENEIKETSLKTQPKPAYQPKTLPLQSRFVLGRELDLQKEKSKVQGLLIPKAIWVVLILIVIAAGFFAFGGMEFIKEFFPTTTPTLQPPTDSTPIETKPSQPPIQQVRNQLVPVSEVAILELTRGKETTLISNIRSTLTETYPLNSINQVIIKYLDNNETLTFKEFWLALGVTPPFGLIDSLEEDFNLLIYNNSNDNRRFGLIAKLKAGTDTTLIKNQFLSWENNFIDDWQILLSSILTTAQGKFQDINLVQTRTRFINTDFSDLGIYYTVETEKGLVLIGTSRESLERLITESS